MLFDAIVNGIEWADLFLGVRNDDCGSICEERGQ